MDNAWIYHIDEGFQEEWGVVFADTRQVASDKVVASKVSAGSMSEAYVLEHLEIESLTLDQFGTAHVTSRSY